MSVQQPKAAMARHPRIAELALALGALGSAPGNS